MFFAGLAIASFLNYYGVIRLGSDFNSKFERQPTVKKARFLLDLCTGAAPAENSGFFKRIQRIASRRNALVHPRTLEVIARNEHEMLESTVLIAEDCIADMEAFFAEYVALDPKARGHVHI